MIFFLLTLAGEEAYRVATEAAGPRERHPRQLRAHLQGGQVQDQTHRGPRPLKNPLIFADEENPRNENFLGGRKMPIFPVQKKYFCPIYG